MSLSSTELHVKVHYLVYRWRCLVNVQDVTLDPHITGVAIHICITGVSIHINGSASHGAEAKISIWKTRQRMACGSGRVKNAVQNLSRHARVGIANTCAVRRNHFSLSVNLRVVCSKSDRGAKICLCASVHPNVHMRESGRLRAVLSWRQIQCKITFMNRRSFVALTAAPASMSCSVHI